MTTSDDAEALSVALSGLVGAVGNLRWWVGQVSEAHPSRHLVPDCSDTLREVAVQLIQLADDLDALPGS